MFTWVGTAGGCLDLEPNLWNFSFVICYLSFPLRGNGRPVAKLPGIEFCKGLRRFSPGKIGRRALVDERVPILFSLSCPVDALDTIPEALGMVMIIYETTPLSPHGVEISDDLS
jgi:hypothetical protein